MKKIYEKPVFVAAGALPKHTATTPQNGASLVDS